LRRLRLNQRNQRFTGRSINRLGNHPILESESDSSVQKNPLKNQGGGKNLGSYEKANSRRPLATRLGQT
jgi:hypothetical protein